MMFTQISQAYHVLSDPIQRAQFDLQAGYTVNSPEEVSLSISLSIIDLIVEISRAFDPAPLSASHCLLLSVLFSIVGVCLWCVAAPHQSVEAGRSRGGCGADGGNHCNSQTEAAGEKR
jgi:hypothetical protein